MRCLLVRQLIILSNWTYGQEIPSVHFTKVENLNVAKKKKYLDMSRFQNITTSYKILSLKFTMIDYLNYERINRIIWRKIYEN